MSNPKETISPGVFFSVLTITFSGLDFLNAPHDVAGFCGPSSYWGVIGAFLILIPIIFLLGALQKRFPNANLFESAKVGIGKPLAFVGNLLYLSVFIIWLLVVVRDATELSMVYLLDRTPMWVVHFGFLAVMGYLAINGLKGVGRMAGFVVVPMVLLRFGLKLAAFNGLNWTLLQPVFSASPLNYLKGAFSILNLFVPIGAVFLIYPMLIKPRSLAKITLGSIGIANLILLLGVIGTIGVFGSEFSQRFNWPNLAAIHRVNIPFLVFEQLGLVFLTVWVIMFLIATSFYFYIIANSLREHFFRGLNYQWTVIVLLLFVGVGGLLFPNSMTVTQSFIFLRRWAIIPIVSYPLLIYLVSAIRGVKE